MYIANEWFASNWSVKSTRPGYTFRGVFAVSRYHGTTSHSTARSWLVAQPDWPPVERFAPQLILSTTKLRKMIDVGAVYGDLFRFVSFLVPIRQGACLRTRTDHTAELSLVPVPSLVWWMKQLSRSRSTSFFRRYVSNYVLNRCWWNE